MKIERRMVGTVELYAPQDALAEDAAEEFNRVLQQACGGPNPRLVIDMGEVGFLDSTGLDGLVTVADQLSERGMQLRLANVAPTCREAFELTGISDRFQFFNDADDAVRSFL